MITVGIDPGKKGAVVVLRDGVDVLLSAVTPVVATKGGDYLVGEMADLLRPFSTNGIVHESALEIQAAGQLLHDTQNAAMTLSQFRFHLGNFLDALDTSKENVAQLAVIEQQRAGQMEGRTSVLTTGRGWGMWESVCATLKIPYSNVTAARWTKVLEIPKPPAKATPAQKKAGHIHAANRLLPGLDLMPGNLRTPHDGLADAGLLAVFAHRTLLGNG